MSIDFFYDRSKSLKILQGFSSRNSLRTFCLFSSENSLTFKWLQIFFSESQVQNLKKKNLSVGMWKITSTWKEHKMITNGEQRHFLTSRNRPHLEMGGDFGKKTLKKNWKSYMQGWFLEKKNKKLKILHEGISIDHFQEVPFFTHI